MFTDDNLHETCEAVFSSLKANPAPYGFHFSYSPESAWKQSTRFLVLTLNPQAKNSERELERIVPEKPCPDINDFFSDKSFPIKTTVQAILWELARLVSKPDDAFSPLQVANNFADRDAVLASFVPFRTASQEDITSKMWKIAKNEYWSKILAVWQPEAIVAIGRQPFENIKEIINSKHRYVDGWIKPVTDFEACSPNVKSGKICNFRYAEFATQNGKKFMLAGLPHPNARGKRGLPCAFPKNVARDSPTRMFLEKIYS